MADSGKGCCPLTDCNEGCMSYNQVQNLINKMLPVLKDGKDGKDGLNGINGTNGTNGQDGTDGIDGATVLVNDTVYSCTGDGEGFTTTFNSYQVNPGTLTKNGDKLYVQAMAEVLAVYPIGPNDYTAPSMVIGPDMYMFTKDFGFPRRYVFYITISRIDPFTLLINGKVEVFTFMNALPNIAYGAVINSFSQFKYTSLLNSMDTDPFLIQFQGEAVGQNVLCSNWLTIDLLKKL